MIRNLSKRLAITIGLISIIGLSGCAVKYDNVAFDPVSKRTIVKNMDAATQNEINSTTLDYFDKDDPVKKAHLFFAVVSNVSL